MTEPNEEVNEELSTEELKSVSGGVMEIELQLQPEYTERTTSRGTQRVGGRDGMVLEGLEQQSQIVSPHGSGFGGTREDWEKSWSSSGSHI